MEQEVRPIKKSIWKDRYFPPKHFICPICLAERQLKQELRFGRIKHYLSAFATTAVAMLLCWPWFGWKGIVLFVPLWAIFEFVYLGVLRGSLVCKNCGFDPYLAKSNPERAAQEVKKRYEDRKQSLTSDSPKR